MIIQKDILYDWDILNKILITAGESVFILNINRFRENTKKLVSAFTAKYTNVSIGYSYKTNFLAKLCVEANKLGLYAEVVSGMEYEIARYLKVPGEKIIFNGPLKSVQEVNRAFDEGALVNVDSYSEAELIKNIANTFDKTCRIGLRCNLDLQWDGRESRFGLSESSGELNEAWRLLSKVPNIQIEGFHCHTSFHRSANSYGRRITRLIELADYFFKNKPPRFLDVGGGLCGPMPGSLAEQFKDTPPSFQDYAESICKPMMARYGNSGPELIVEPGVGLIGDTMDYAYRVAHVKQVGNRKFAITSGAAHQIKIVPNQINLPTVIFREKGRSIQENEELIDIVGFTCLEHDVIYRGLKGAVARDDILVTRNVGAYSIFISPDFIRPSPMVVELDEKNGTWNLLRRSTSTKQLIESFEW